MPPLYKRCSSHAQCGFALGAEPHVHFSKRCIRIQWRRKPANPNQQPAARCFREKGPTVASRVSADSVQRAWPHGPLFHVEIEFNGRMHELYLPKPHAQFETGEFSRNRGIEARAARLNNPSCERRLPATVPAPEPRGSPTFLEED